ncbi:hypothetical protein HDU76_000768 [Blyttiomyces sp. JEL0837]|nr:hypothetical protein HDU76_000768 [Blyttiomyces sp. JEL0837]
MPPTISPHANTLVRYRSEAAALQALRPGSGTFVRHSNRCHIYNLKPKFLGQYHMLLRQRIETPEGEQYYEETTVKLLQAARNTSVFKLRKVLPSTKNIIEFGDASGVRMVRVAKPNGKPGSYVYFYLPLWWVWVDENNAETIINDSSAYPTEPDHVLEELPADFDHLGARSRRPRTTSGEQVPEHNPPTPRSQHQSPSTSSHPPKSAHVTRLHDPPVAVAPPIAHPVHTTQHRSPASATAAATAASAAKRKRPANEVATHKQPVKVFKPEPGAPSAAAGSALAALQEQVYQLQQKVERLDEIEHLKMIINQQAAEIVALQAHVRRQDATLEDLVCCVLEDKPVEFDA